MVMRNRGAKLRRGLRRAPGLGTDRVKGLVFADLNGRTIRRDFRLALLVILPMLTCSSLCWGQESRFGTSDSFAYRQGARLSTQESGGNAPIPQAKKDELFTPASSEFRNNATEEELAARILTLRGMLPTDLRRPKGMTVDQLHALVDETLSLGELYLTRFPEGKTRKEVLPAVARLWVVNNTRYFVALSQKYRENDPNNQSMPKERMAEIRRLYWGKVAGIIAEALQLNTEGETHEEMLRLQGQSSWFANNFDDAIVAYKKLIEQYPDSPKASEDLLALLNSHISARKHEIAVRLADRFLQTYPRDDLVPHVYQLKAKALLEAGRAREALAWWLSIGDTLSRAAAGQPVEINGEPYVWQKSAREAFQRYLDERRFMIGFLQGWLGDFEDARNSFANALEALNDIQDKGTLDPRSQVFQSRTDRVLQAYLSLVGEIMPELTIDTWLDDVPLDPKAEEGNVVVLLFAPYENARYEEFQQILQRLYQDHWHEGLRVGWIADPKGFSKFPDQVERINRHRNRLALTYPIGLETERDWPTFRRCLASVGGGSLLVVDRSGRVVWYKMDPTFRDENLIGGLVTRLLQN